jgi:hypothetical protein
MPIYSVLGLISVAWSLEPLSGTGMVMILKISKYVSIDISGILMEIYKYVSD